MAIQWSGLGPELLLQLDRGRGQPLRSQLEAGLRDAIRRGRLQSGERLPSSRELARDLGISRGLVQECYSQLLAEGYLISQVGAATGCGRPEKPAAACPRRILTMVTRAAAWCCARCLRGICGACAPQPPTLTASSSAMDSPRGSISSCERSLSWASGVPRWKIPATGTWRPAIVRGPPGRWVLMWCMCPST